MLALFEKGGGYHSASSALIAKAKSPLSQFLGPRGKNQLLQ